MRSRILSAFIRSFYEPAIFRISIRDLLWLMLVCSLIVIGAVQRYKFRKQVLVKLDQNEVAALAPGEKYEIEALEGGEFKSRIVPAKP